MRLQKGWQTQSSVRTWQGSGFRFQVLKGFYSKIIRYHPYALEFHWWLDQWQESAIQNATPSVCKASCWVGSASILIDLIVVWNIIMGFDAIRWYGTYKESWCALKWDTFKESLRNILSSPWSSSTSTAQRRQSVPASGSNSWSAEFQLHKLVTRHRLQCVYIYICT